MNDTQPVTLQGTVTRYKGNGRQLGYPTANLSTETAAADGVYFGFADLAGFARHPSLVFVGVPVTVGDKERRVEAHLLDIPDENYYGRPLSLTLDHFHRPNQAFAGIDELLVAMKADETAARQWFKEQKA